MTASIASTGASSSSKAQCAAVRIHAGATRVPVQLATLSSGSMKSPSALPSHAESMKAIDGQSSISRVLTADDGRGRAGRAGRAGRGGGAERDEGEQGGEDQQTSEHRCDANRPARRAP